MARYIYQGTTRDGNGRVILSATVSVYLATTITAANIYSASSGGTAVNSVTSSSTNGKYLFYIDDGDYASSQLFKISFSRSGYETGTWDNISIVGNSAASVVTLADTQTLTNKTLTAPTITGPTITGPTITGTIGGTPTITTPVIASFYQDAAKTKLMTTPNTASDTLVTLAATQTLTGKSLTSPTITGTGEAAFNNAVIVTDIYTTAWTTYGATTIVGWSVVTVGNIYYKKIGKLVFVNFLITGTSNTTGVTFTLPYASANIVNTTTVAISGADNGSSLTGAARAYLPAASSTVTCYKDMASGAWTGSGTKMVQGEFFYHTD